MTSLPEGKGDVWKMDCSYWDAGTGEMGREAKTAYSLALRGD